MHEIETSAVLATAQRKPAKVRVSRLGYRLLLASARLSMFAVLLPLCTALVALVRALLILSTPPVQWRFGAWAVHRFFGLSARLLGLRVEVKGRVPAAGTLVVANHHSYLDAVALGSLLEAVFAAKREVAGWPLIGLGARAAGVVFIDRQAPANRGVRDLLTAHLDAGLTVVNFAEGTTSAQRRPLPFRPGLFRAIAGRQTEVVPTYIAYDDPEAHWVDDDTFLRHLLALACRPTTVVRIAFSEPIAAASYRDGDELRDTCYESVARPRPAADASVGYGARGCAS